jgi:sugar-specific transcriptional regulator TrmB
MIRDDCKSIQILVRLGLTRLQATVYFNLAKLGEADVKTISQASGVSRSGVYRVMPQLEGLGLAQKIIAPQTVYRATPLDEGSELLLDREEQKIIELHERAMRLIEHLSESNGDKPNVERKLHFPLF